jgi:DNA (cytosine-5)-methyltransferase 1
MRLLDLFCGAGGAAVGYHRAGFDQIVGVDIEPQPRYPFEFVQEDAFSFLNSHGREFDLIHASPPCQAYSALRTMWNDREHPDFIGPLRATLLSAARPYIIENVIGAPLISPVMLCGTMFNLGIADAELWRHRLFEIHPLRLLLTPTCQHRTKPKVIGIYGGHGRDRR